MTLETPPNFRRVCYLHMRPEPNRARLMQVDGRLCTHLVLAFARIDGDGRLQMGHADDSAYLGDVRAFKRLHPSVKVMVSVLDGFQNVACNNEARQKLAKSAVEFMQRHELDGLDLNWQFPNFPTSILGARDFERAQLTKIVEALRSAVVENFYARQLAAQHANAPRSRLLPAPFSTGSLTPGSDVEPHLVSVAVAGQESVLRSSYELRQLANLCDWLNVMSFDYFLFKAYAPFTGPNSPLFPVVEPFVPIISKLAFSWTVGRLLDEQVPADKIVMGIPTYARAYKLVFRHTVPSAFALSVGARGGQLDDYLTFGEVAEILARDDTRADFDTRARVPYLLTDNGYTWISYENVQSVREKVRYVMQHELGGYMTWNLNSDNFPLVPSVNDKQISAADSTNALAKPDNGLETLAAAAPRSKLAPDGAQPNDTTTTTTTTTTEFPLHRAMFDEASFCFTQVRNHVPSGQ